MPASSPTPVVSKLDQLKADAVMVRERIAAMDPASFADVASLAQFLKDELSQNVVPMFEATVEAVLDDIGSEVDRLSDDFEQYIAETGDQLGEQAAQSIVAVFQQGLIVSKMLEDALPKLDDVRRKRAKEAIRTYRAAELAMREFVQSIVVEDEDPGDPDQQPQDEPEGDESDGDGDADGDQDAAPDESQPAEGG